MNARCLTTDAMFSPLVQHSEACTLWVTRVSCRPCFPLAAHAAPSAKPGGQFTKTRFSGLPKKSSEKSRPLFFVRNTKSLGYVTE